MTKQKLYFVGILIFHGFLEIMTVPCNSNVNEHKFQIICDYSVLMKCAHENK